MRRVRKRMFSRASNLDTIPMACDNKISLRSPTVRPAVAFALPQVSQAMRMGSPFSSVTADSCEYRRPDCYHLVLLRHGESEWNAAKRFTGWVDVDLTEKGRIQAMRAGRALKKHSFEFDEAHASVLKRAVRTLWTALHSSDHHWIPVRHSWRLNERHYGGLTGLSKAAAESDLGPELLLQYRRGYDVQPLPMDESHPYWTGNDRRYRDLGALLPKGESLKMCKQRILPYWFEAIVPSIRSGRNVLVAAHNNVLRCIIKHLDNIDVENLRDIEIPTGRPIIYNLSRETLEPVGEADENGFRGQYISDDEITLDDGAYSDHIQTAQVINLDALRREAERLGLDFSNIKFISEITDQQLDGRGAADTTHAAETRSSMSWKDRSFKQTGF